MKQHWYINLYLTNIIILKHVNYQGSDIRSGSSQNTTSVQFKSKFILPPPTPTFFSKVFLQAIHMSIQINVTTSIHLP
jgi:hypothetical protein